MRAGAASPIDKSVRHIERRQWWLFSSGIVVTILLTAGIISFALPVLNPGAGWFSVDTSLAVHALLGLVLLFDVYVVLQQFQIHRFRQRVREREELFRLIGENAADMIAVVDADGRRLYSSPSYKKLLGYSDEELQQTTFYEHIHPDDCALVASATNEARQSGIGRRVEYRIRRKDDSWLVVESTASLVQNQGSAGKKMVIVNRDITERKQLEEQLYLSQKLEAIGRLSGGVAHDFNNLLGVIIGYSEALQKQMGAEHPFREAIEEIQNAGNRAATLTQQLLAFSRKQVLEPKVIDLNMVVSEVQKMLRRLIGEDIALKISLHEHLGMVKADRGQIDQVILNLAVNARDAMPKGGKLIIETRNAELTEADANRYRYVIPGSYVLLKVTDTGCGMDAELQSHIFEPFFTTKEQGKGTGLGLATVYGVIKQSGGYIWVESEVGRGATFKVYLPRVEEVREVVPERTAFGRPQRSRTILLVEDEHSLRKLTRNTLQEAGHTVLEACDASEALDVAKRTDSRIDLLLTDVVMPGMSGRVLADELATLRPGIKVIYMSGYTDGDVATHGVLQSGISFLRKPFTGDALIGRVDEILSIPVLTER